MLLVCYTYNYTQNVRRLEGVPVLVQSLWLVTVRERRRSVWEVLTEQRLSLSAPETLQMNQQLLWTLQSESTPTYTHSTECVCFMVE